MIGGAGVRATALEAALADLERALCRDRCHVVVRASTGPAQSRLLGALAERLSGVLRVIPVVGSEGEEDPCLAILRELGEPIGDDAEASLIGVAHRMAGQGSALALLVGDARSLPAPTLRSLGRLATRSRPGLRLILVHAQEASERDASAEIMATLGVGAVKVVLDPPASPGRPSAGPPGLAPRELPARPTGLAPPRAAPEPRRHAHRAPLALAAALALGLGLVVWQREAGTQGPSAPALRAPAPPAHPVTAASPPREAAPPAAPHPGEPGADAERAVPAKPAPPPALVRAAEAAVPAAPAPAPTPPVPAPLGAAADLLASAADATPTASPVAVEVESTPVSVSRGPSLAEQEVVAAIADDGSVRASLVRVSLNAQPWAHIEVDGRDLGVTPMADVELEAGPHRFRARFADGRVMERTLRVDALRDHITFP